MMKECSIKKGDDICKMAFSLCQGWTWGAQSKRAQSGVMVSSCRPYETGWPMPRRDWPKQGDHTNHKL